MKIFKRMCWIKGGNHMKKIAIITNMPSPYRVDFFDYIRHHYEDFKITVIYFCCSLENRQWQINQEKIEEDIFLKSIRFKIKNDFDNRYVFIAKGVKKELKKLGPDVVIGMEYNPVVIQACRWCKRNNISYISWTDGTLNSEKDINYLQKLSRRYIVNNSKVYIASSSKAKEAQIAYGAPEKNIFVCYLTVDIDKYHRLNIERDDIQLLYVGSLVKRKGVDLLLNALALMKRNYKMVIVGDGLEKENLENLAMQLGIAQKVHFKGYVEGEELVELYSSSSVFILPTREDCYALVILEAMCAGLPVVCSKYADGAYDLIVDEKNGYIINPYDIEELALVMEKLLIDHTKRERMSEETLKIVERFRFMNTSKAFVRAVEASGNG